MIALWTEKATFVVFCVLKYSRLHALWTEKAGLYCVVFCVVKYGRLQGQRPLALWTRKESLNTIAVALKCKKSDSNVFACLYGRLHGQGLLALRTKPNQNKTTTTTNNKHNTSGGRKHYVNQYKVCEQLVLWSRKASLSSVGNALKCQGWTVSWTNSVRVLETTYSETLTTDPPH